MSKGNSCLVTLSGAVGRGRKLIGMTRPLLALLAAILLIGTIGGSSQVSAQDFCLNVWHRGGQFSCPNCTRPEGMPVQSLITNCMSDPNAGDPVGGWIMCDADG